VLTIFTAASGKLVYGLSARQKYWIILRPLWATHHHHPPPPNPNATACTYPRPQYTTDPPMVSEYSEGCGGYQRIPQSKQLEA